MGKVNIKKGGRYQCYNIKYNGIIGVNTIIGFTVGKTYVSHKDGYLRNDNNNEMTFFHDAAKFFSPVYVMKHNKKTD